MIITVIFMLSFSACDDDDFAQYESYSKGLSIEIIGNIFVPSEVLPELEALVSEYEQGLFLTKVEYTFESNSDTKAVFSFTKRKDDTLMGWNVEVYVNCSNKNAFLLEYNYGHSKRLAIGKIIEEYESQIEKMNTNAYEVFENYMNKSNLETTIPDKIKIVYNFSVVLLSNYTGSNVDVVEIK